MGNLTTIASDNDPLHVVLLTYEFTFSPFSGNGILSRSLAKSLLEQGCQITVWCCRPAREHATEDNPLTPPEISEQDATRLDVRAVTLPEEVGWRRLDAESGWSEFNWQFLAETDALELASALEMADAVCAIDWTGGLAFKSIPQHIRSRRIQNPPMVYLNFRVYSSGVSDVKMHEWYNDKERHALCHAQTIIVLSEKDKQSLQDLMDNSDLSFPGRERIHMLHPPLRADMEKLAKLSPEHFQNSHDLPCQHSAAIQNYHGHAHKCFVTCLVRLSPEKDAMRFIKFIEATSHILAECGLTPFLAGAASDEHYANRVKGMLACVAPHAIVVESFLSPKELAAVLSRTALNFHPCSYDAYGMTIVEAAAFGVPSVVASGNVIGATAIVHGDGVFEVEMPPVENNGGRNEPDLTGPGVTELSAILQDRSRMKKTGLVAKKQALAWDEKAYGNNLIEHIENAIEFVNDVSTQHQ